MPPSDRRYLDQVVTRPGPFTDPDVKIGDEVINHLESVKVLLVNQSKWGPCGLLMRSGLCSSSK